MACFTCITYFPYAWKEITLIIEMFLSQTPLLLLLLLLTI
jgi:hypothetical protein